MFHDNNKSKEFIHEIEWAKPHIFECVIANAANSFFLFVQICKKLDEENIFQTIYDISHSFLNNVFAVKCKKI